jgi:hypothetical protein
MLCEIENNYRAVPAPVPLPEVPVPVPLVPPPQKRSAKKEVEGALRALGRGGAR